MVFDFAAKNQTPSQIYTVGNGLNGCISLSSTVVTQDILEIAELFSPEC